ncbi:MAG: serine/threonine-protein kinase [Eubacteriales bacterium]|nr:serine/threonine-protein kinase [Eubacteriales bacterium]
MNRCYHCFESLRDRNADSCPYCGTPLKHIEWDSKRYLKPGTILQNKFFVGNAIGKGGFGNTYVGWNEVLQCKVAIKEYFPTNLTARGEDGVTVSITASDTQGYFQSGLEQFLEEARNVASLQDVKGVVQIYNFFQENGTGYIIMEFLEGMDVKQILRERGNRVDYEWSRRVILTVLHTLREIHKRGILHRDIAPDNIFVTNEGVIKLIDFGAAKSAAAGGERQRAIVLKSGYAPIEQYTRTMQQGPYTDLYAVAALFYRMLTGTKPPSAPDRMRLDRMEPLSAKGIQIPESAEMAITMCLYIDPEYRLQSADEFMEALDGSDFQPVYEPEWILPQEEEPPQTLMQKIRDISNAKKAMVLCGIVAVIVLCVVISSVVKNMHKSDRYVETSVASKFSIRAGQSYDEFKRAWTGSYGFSEEQLELDYYYDNTVSSDTIQEFTDLTTDPEAGLDDFPIPGCFTNGNTLSNFQDEVKAYDSSKKMMRLVIASPYRVDFDAAWANGLPYNKDAEAKITYDQEVLPGEIVTEDGGDTDAWGKISSITYDGTAVSAADLAAQNPVDIHKLKISVYTGDYYLLSADAAQSDYVGQNINKIKMPFGNNNQFKERELSENNYSATYYSFTEAAGTIAEVKSASLKAGEGYDGRVDAPIMFGTVKEQIGIPLGSITVAQLRKYCKVKGPKDMKASDIVTSVDQTYFDKDTEVTVEVTEEAVATKAPVVTEAPKPTAKPKATKKPKKNQDPMQKITKATKKPKVTKKPVSKPKPTKKPAKKSKKKSKDPLTMG